MNLLQNLKAALMLSGCFIMISGGVLFLQLRSDAVRITASTQQTFVAAQATLGHLDATLTDAKRVLETANGTLNIARHTLQNEEATLKAANAATVKSMQDLDVLVQNVDTSQKQIVVNVADTLKAVQTTVVSVAPVMQQTQRDLADLEPVIAQSNDLLKQSTDTMTNVSKSTADIAAEIHRYVYPPPQKWYQKIWGPIKLAVHMVSVPI